MAGRPGGLRLTGTIAMVAMAGFAVLAYSGAAPALVAGYTLEVLAASVFGRQWAP